MDGYHREWMGTILTRKPLCCKRFGARWERLGSLAGGESGIRTHGTVSPLRRIQLQSSGVSRDANCGHEIKLTASLAAPLREETRRRLQDQMRRRMPGIAAVIEAQSEVRTIELEIIGGRVIARLGDVVRPFAKLGAHLSSKPRRRQRDFTFEKNSPD